MNTLSPKQAACIARDVYELKLHGISLAMENKKGLSLTDDAHPGGGFLRPAEKFTGRTGFIKKAAGFGFVAEGVGYRSGQYLIAMRGTTGMIAISRDWQSNYRINMRKSKTGFAVHAGFQSIFEDFLPDLDAFFRNKQGTVHAVGHSLGGALATLSADYLASLGRFAVKVYTFGAPRVGLEGFCRNFTKVVKRENIYRVYHTTDPVPMIAPFPYIHAPFTAMQQLNWGLGIAKSGRIVPNDHGKEIYVQTASQYADWSALSSTNMEPDKTWEVWLKETVESNLGGIIQFSATVMIMISKCLAGILEKAVDFINLPHISGETVVDRLAWMLYRCALSSVKVASNLKNLIHVIYRFLGKPSHPAIDLTVGFLRWIFNLLYSNLQIAAQRAINMDT